MKELLKKLNVRSYLLAGALLVTIVGFILSIASNAVFGYSIENYGFVVLTSIFALLFICGTVYLHMIKKGFIGDLLGLLSVALLLISGIIIISSRADLIGTLWVTALDSVNPMANAAMNTGFPAFVLYVVAAIITVVSSFFKDE